MELAGQKVSSRQICHGKKRVRKAVLEIRTNICVQILGETVESIDIDVKHVFYHVFF